MFWSDAEGVIYSAAEFLQVVATVFFNMSAMASVNGRWSERFRLRLSGMGRLHGVAHAGSRTSAGGCNRGAAVCGQRCSGAVTSAARS